MSLAPFEPNHTPLLAAWLARPHVARWFPNAASFVDWARRPPHGGAHALIVLDASPVGYMRWAKVSREALDAVGLPEIPAGSVDIDMLIGETDSVGRGHGPAALRLLVDTLRDDAIPLVGLSPSIDNAAAHRAYEKAGFRKVREYDTPGFGRCSLMVTPLER
jgi:aminoglycoside 6'-N-acetyltransferase